MLKLFQGQSYGGLCYYRIGGTTTKQQHNNSGFQQMISSLTFLDSKCYYATSIVKVRNTCCSQYVELKLSYCAQLKNACLLIKKELLESVPGFCQQGEGVPLKKIECAQINSKDIFRIHYWGLQCHTYSYIMHFSHYNFSPLKLHSLKFGTTYLSISYDLKRQF